VCEIDYWITAGPPGGIIYGNRSGGGRGWAAKITLEAVGNIWQSKYLEAVDSPASSLDHHAESRAEIKRFAVSARPESDEKPGNAHVTFLLNFFDAVGRKVPVGK
jgi:hypothetical protein